FITGFTDGEGSWGLSISKDSTRKMGYSISPKFTIGLHANDIALLERIAAQFGVGNISIGSNNLIRWHVSSVKDLVNVIIPFFEKYPLISKKRADFDLFKRVVELVNNKEHMTQAGLQEIINIKASLNNGNLGELKVIFPDTKPVPRPLVKFTEIPDPN
ncbi:homing endonuclease, partial [Terfezia boudieri ATCC MYA-4762]